MTRQADDRAARFLRHLEPLKAALEAYCRRCVHDPNAVEDVLQEAIGTAYRDFHLYAEGTNFRAWIFRYVNLTIHTGNRSYHRQRSEALADEPMVDGGWDLEVDDSLIDLLLERPDELLRDCDDALAAAIGDLGSLERSALLLRAIGQFHTREMAEILDVPMGTVMSAVSRARTRLRLRLAEYARQNNLLRHPVTKRK